MRFQSFIRVSEMKRKLDHWKQISKCIIQTYLVILVFKVVGIRLPLTLLESAAHCNQESTLKILQALYKRYIPEKP
jgi:hypothetical protein